MFKLHFNFIHIGDQISTTAIPENIYKLTGEKVVVTDPRIWVFRHNPYVEHWEESQAQDLPVINLMPDCRMADQRKVYIDKVKLPITAGQTEYMCINMGLEEMPLRHSRLYIYEDLDIDPCKVVVHTQGSDRTRDGEPAIRYQSGEDHLRIMSDEVIESILKNYKDFKIVQVGSQDDRPLGGNVIDCRGKYDYWETIKEISTAARFVGINSGPMHMANCYPRVDKRVVLMEFPEKTLWSYRPGDVRHWLFSWIDPTNMFFNRFKYDVGFTYSYTKL